MSWVHPKCDECNLPLPMWEEYYVVNGKMVCQDCFEEEIPERETVH